MMIPNPPHPHRHRRHRLLITLPILLLTTPLIACSSVTTESKVAQAYNSAGLIKVPPYDRSIFSSTNF